MIPILFYKHRKIAFQIKSILSVCQAPRGSQALSFLPSLLPSFRTCLLSKHLVLRYKEFQATQCQSLELWVSILSHSLKCFPGHYMPSQTLTCSKSLLDIVPWPCNLLVSIGVDHNTHCFQSVWEISVLTPSWYPHIPAMCIKRYWYGTATYTMNCSSTA